MIQRLTDVGLPKSPIGMRILAGFICCSHQVQVLYYNLYATSYKRLTDIFYNETISNSIRVEVILKRGREYQVWKYEGQFIMYCSVHCNNETTSRVSNIKNNNKIQTALKVLLLF